MRDKRFVAAHRGGPLSADLHRQLALWAADCAEHVLPIFTARSEDGRPQRAIAAARAWAKGESSVDDARAAAVAAHTAARSASGKVLSRQPGAAGHAVATAHMADHSLAAAAYAMKAVEATGVPCADELTWQNEHLPEGIRALVLSAR